MKRRLTIFALTALAVVALISVVLTYTAPAHAGGAEQISGKALFDPADSCDAEGQGADFANIMTDDLEGCLYVFVDFDNAECSPSGTYRETGTERFVGTAFGGETGTFETTYLFTAKFDKCEYVEGIATPGGAQHFGRCQHPIVKGSGTDAFAGVTGRFDLKDNIVEGAAVDFSYRGHLRW